MRRKNGFGLYTCMWIVAIVILMVLLLQNLGDARIVNYSGIVRGATQKLVKEELAGQPDDALILRLDGIMANLRTGKGDYHLNRNDDKTYQEQLTSLDDVWRQMKDEVLLVRSGEDSGEYLYELSQRHFSLADQMVLRAEQTSDNKLILSISVYAVALLVSVFIFTILNRRNRRALERSIYTDNLTGIRNQAGFEAEASYLLRQRSAEGFCLLEFDIDDFKFLNNTYGYELGNELLRALADRLRLEFHTGECCARISADDFVVLAKQDGHTVSRLRKSLSDTLAQSHFRNTCEFVTFTIGGYEFVGGEEVIQRSMDKANMAHKNAKVLGKAMLVWYNESFLERLNHENQLTNRMHRALEGQEFQMYLQPKCSLSDQSICSAEALVRWDLPKLGLVPPDDFIPLFERNGSIAELDFYILEKACAHIRRHMDAGHGAFFIAVNFSRVSLFQQDFYSRVIDTVDRMGIPRRCIEIEITESAFNEISDVMTNKLLRLKQDGFLIAMDDFGAGYSNLNSLSKMPIQVLKLDREFLHDATLTDRAKSMISCVTELAHQLDLKVVCEGIETQGQMEFLREIGCDYGQGYFFSKPIPEAEFQRRYEKPQS